MKDRKSPFFIFLILMLLIALLISGIKIESPSRITVARGYEAIPANSSLMFSYNTSLGHIYGFSQGNSSALVLPLTLPLLVLDRGSILGRFNATNVSFTLSQEYMGTDIFRISGLNISMLAEQEIPGKAFYLHFIGGIGANETFISDTVKSHIIMGNLHGVKTGISDLMGKKPSTREVTLNTEDNVSIFSLGNSGSVYRTLSVNSNSNETLISISIRNQSSLTRVQLDLNILESYFPSGILNVSMKGLNITLNFRLNFRTLVSAIEAVTPPSLYGELI